MILAVIIAFEPDLFVRSTIVIVTVSRVRVTFIHDGLTEGIPPLSTTNVAGCAQLSPSSVNTTIFRNIFILVASSGLGLHGAGASVTTWAVVTAGVRLERTKLCSIAASRRFEAEIAAGGSLMDRRMTSS